MEMVDRADASADAQPLGRRRSRPSARLWRRSPRAAPASRARAGRRSPKRGCSRCRGCAGSAAAAPRANATSPPCSSRSGLSAPPRWPPLSRTAAGPSRCSRSAAAAMAARSVAGGSPSRAAASGRLGVIRLASGSRRSRRVVTASSCSSRSPPLATMTGSSTIQRGRQAPAHRRPRRSSPACRACRS